MNHFFDENLIQEKMIDLIFELETQNNQEYINNNDLLILSLFVNENKAKHLFLKYLNNVQKIESQIPLICYVSQRFSTSEEIFSYLMSKIISEKFDFQKDYQSLDIKNRKYLPILLTFLLSITKLPKNEYTKQIFNIILKLFQNKQQILFLKDIIPYFYNFLKGKCITSNKIPLIDDIQSLNNIFDKTYEQTLLLIQKKNIFLDFINKFKENNFGIKKPYPNNYIKFLKLFLYDMINTFLNNFKKSKENLRFIITNSKKKVIEKVLIKIYKNNNNKINDKTYIKGLSYITLYYFNKKSKEVNEEFIKIIINFCQNAITLQYYIIFLINSLDKIDDETRNIFFNNISLNIEQIFLKNYSFSAIYLLSEIYKHKYNVTNNFMDKFYPKVKQILNNHDYNDKQFLQIINNSQTFETFLNLNLNFETFEISNIIKEKIETFYQQFNKPNQKIIITNLFYDNLIPILYQNIFLSSIKSLYYLQNFYKLSNIYLRENEKRFTRIYYHITKYYNFKSTEEHKSFRLYQNNLLQTIPRNIIIPSKYTINSPNNTNNETQQIIYKNYQMKLSYIKTENISNEYPNDLYINSLIFEYKSLIDIFNNINPKYNLMYNCNFIKLELCIPSILFKKGNNLKILLNSKINEQNDIELIHEPISNILIESILQNDYGKYSLFCGNFIIKVKEEDILHINKYIFASNPNSYQIQTINSSSFILEFFNNEIINFNKINSFLFLNQQNNNELNKWLNTEISNFQYLMQINVMSNRTFDDLCSYPIFPRLIINLQKELNESNLITNIRNLKVPIFYVNQTEITKEKLQNTFNNQHYHQSENLSNPLIICTMLTCMPPFCLHQWDVNKGWDKQKRFLTSIPTSFSILKSKTCEFSPEMYSFPEIFINLNEFILDDGNKYKIELPHWSKDVFRFIEYHRYVLENNYIRTNLNNWIDLVFGINQKGDNAVENLNVFNPLSYYDINNNKENFDNVHNWMITCGQVPLQIFTEKHKISKEIQKLDVNQFKIQLNQKIDRKPKIKVEVIENQSSILIFSTKIKSPFFMFIRNYSFSENYMFLSITTTLSDVLILRMRYEQTSQLVELISKVTFICPKFSILNENHLLCFTVCVNEIIIWSFVNEIKIASINITNVRDLIIDNDSDNLFVFDDNCLYQFTFNGFFVRKMSFETKINSFALTSVGYSIFDKIIVLGMENGAVNLVKVSFETSEFEIVKKFEISSLPITKIYAENRNNIIYVYDESCNSEN